MSAGSPAPDEQSRPEPPEERFEQIYRAELATVQAWLRARTGSDADGDELAAETFARAYRGWHGFRGESTRRSWLWRIAHNTLKNWFRGRGRETVVPEARPTIAADPADVATEQRAAVWEILGRIEGEQARRATYLRYVEGRSADEVGAELGITPGAVRTLTYRTLAALRQELEDHRG